MEDLTPRQYRALVYLASGGSNKEAAEIAGVSLRSIESWKAQPNFKRQLREATAKVFDMAIARLILNAELAADQLCEIIKNEEISEKTRITAISLLFTHAAKAKEWALEERLERVELALDGGNQQEQDTED